MLQKPELKRFVGTSHRRYEEDIDSAGAPFGRMMYSCRGGDNKVRSEKEEAGSAAGLEVPQNPGSVRGFLNRIASKVSVAFSAANEGIKKTICGSDVANADQQRPSLRAPFPLNLLPDLRREDRQPGYIVDWIEGLLVTHWRRSVFSQSV